MASTRGVWHLLVRAEALADAATILADEAMPDADRERGRRQALRIAISVMVSGNRQARSEMPDTSGSALA